MCMFHSPFSTMELRRCTDKTFILPEPLMSGDQIFFMMNRILKSALISEEIYQLSILKMFR